MMAPKKNGLRGRCMLLGDLKNPRKVCVEPTLTLYFVIYRPFYRLSFNH